jgi:hypothetical protein
MRSELTYDGCGINGPDEYRSRVATFANYDLAGKYGPLLAAAPELLAEAELFVSDFVAYLEADDYDLPDPSALIAAIAKAKGPSQDKSEGQAGPGG